SRSSYSLPSSSRWLCRCTTTAIGWCAGSRARACRAPELIRASAASVSSRLTRRSPAVPSLRRLMVDVVVALVQHGPSIGVGGSPDYLQVAARPGIAACRGRRRCLRPGRYRPNEDGAVGRRIRDRCRLPHGTPPLRSLAGTGAAPTDYHARSIRNVRTRGPSASSTVQRYPALVSEFPATGMAPSVAMTKPAAVV